MIFVHILKCIPARYQHDEDAEDALVLGRRKVHGRDETPIFMYTCRRNRLSRPAVPSMKSNERRTNFNPFAHKFPRIVQFKRSRSHKIPFVLRSLETIK